MDSGPVGSVPILLVITTILIFMNAYIASREVAILSVNKDKIKYLGENGDKKAILLLDMIENPIVSISSVRGGLLCISFFVSFITGAYLAKYLVDILYEYNFPFGYEVYLIFTTIALFLIVTIFGNVIPLRKSIKNSEDKALSSVKNIIFISKIMKPFINIACLSKDFLFKNLNFKKIPQFKEDEPRDNIKSLVKAGKEQGLINSHKKEMIEGIISFDKKIAKEVMIPRIEVFSLNIDSPIREISSKLLFQNFSRVPVYEKEIDNIIGILYMKDFFYEANRIGIDNIELRKILRKPYFVPQTKPIDDLFEELKVSKNHMAVLVGEYGGFSGIVTIEDLIEEVMGDIFDEYDEEYDEIKKIDEKTYVVDGLLSIDEVNERLNVNIKTECFETIGGFVVSLIGSVPKHEVQKKIKYEDIIFEVEEMSSKRIEKIKLCLGE